MTIAIAGVKSCAVVKYHQYVVEHVARRCSKLMSYVQACRYTIQLQLLY